MGRELADPNYVRELEKSFDSLEEVFLSLYKMVQWDYQSVGEKEIPKPVKGDIYKHAEKVLKHTEKFIDNESG